MSNSERHFARQQTVPPFSTRTLHHPSFMPLYMAAQLDTDCVDQTVCPVTPAECFYTDPSMSCGMRIPNIVNGLSVLDCFQLSTPPPVMSACPAPPPRPDPFRSGPHPTRDLGSRTLSINTSQLPVQQRCRVVLHLTAEEDQAVTNLLKLHHQEPDQSEDTLTALQMHFSSIDLNPIQFHHTPMDSTSAKEVYEPSCSDVQHLREASLQSQLQQRCWSDTELQAAETLLSQFNLMESDKIWGQSQNISTATLPDPDEYLASSLPPRPSSFSSVSEAKSKSSVSGNVAEVKEGTLSNSECVQVLLSLGDTEALDIV